MRRDDRRDDADFVTTYSPLKDTRMRCISHVQATVSNSIDE
jgi:hypothetical protein